MPKTEKASTKANPKKPATTRAKKAITSTDLEKFGKKLALDISRELKKYVDTSNADLKKHVDTSDADLKKYVDTSVSNMGIKLLKEIHARDKRHEDDKDELKQDLRQIITMIDRLTHLYKGHEQERMMTAARIERVEISVEEHDQRIGALENTR